MQYKVVRKHRKGENEYQDIIEITGLKSTVTVNQLLDHLEKVEKTLREQQGQVKVNEMLMEKAVEELPILKEIPDDKLNLVVSYFGKKLANKQSTELISDCKKSSETYRKHLEEIENQTGIKCVPQKSPFTANEEAK